MHRGVADDLLDVREQLIQSTSVSMLSGMVRSTFGRWPLSVSKTMCGPYVFGASASTLRSDYVAGFVQNLAAQA